MVFAQSVYIQSDCIRQLYLGQQLLHPLVSVNGLTSPSIGLYFTKTTDA